MRQCSACRKFRKVEEFNFRNRVRGERHSYCKVCGTLKTRAHYASNKAYYLQKASKRNERIRVLVRSFIVEYLKSHPCVDCGEEDIYVLDFDHCRGKKIHLISDIVRTGYSLETVQHEISKCDVRCANCHRRKTRSQLGWHSAELS